MKILAGWTGSSYRCVVSSPWAPPAWVTVAFEAIGQQALCFDSARARGREIARCHVTFGSSILNFAFLVYWTRILPCGLDADLRTSVACLHLIIPSRSPRESDVPPSLIICDLIINQTSSSSSPSKASDAPECGTSSGPTQQRNLERSTERERSPRENIIVKRRRESRSSTETSSIMEISVTARRSRRTRRADHQALSTSQPASSPK